MKIGDRVEMLPRIKRTGYKGIVIDSWVRANGEPVFSVLWQSGVRTTERLGQIEPIPDTWRLPIKLRRALQEQIDHAEEAMRKTRARLRPIREVLLHEMLRGKP